MELTVAIKEGWAWSGADPLAVIEMNRFGNVIFKDRAGLYWRVMPEELKCEVLASEEHEFTQLWKSEDFQVDWRMDLLADEAEAVFGPLGACQSYYFLVPNVLVGSFSIENMRVISTLELMRVSGSMALQIRNLADGTQVEIKVRD
jgi:hypothetical protein